jgi:hypothetical protein
VPRLGFGSGRASASTARPSPTPAVASPIWNELSLAALIAFSAASYAVTRTSALSLIWSGRIQTYEPVFTRPRTTDTHGPVGPESE